MADQWCNQPAQSGCGTCTQPRVARDSGAWHDSHPQWRCYCPQCLTTDRKAYNSSSNCKQYCTQPSVIAEIRSSCRLPSPPQPGVCKGAYWAEPSLLWDPSSESVLLSYTRIDRVLGGCDSNEQNEVGLFILSSTDRGLTFGQPQRPKLIGAPSSCLTPTGGVVISRGPHSGRQLYMLPRESYGGEVVAYSDDKGDSWSVSPSLFSPGLDESNVAQTSNGSLFAVMRNCFTKAGGVAHGCSLETNDDGQLSAGPSAHRVAVSVSNDGGQFWTKPRLHSDLVTPTCQSSLLQYGDTLLFVGPRSETSRSNLTVLASDDNGETFRRSLQLVPGQAGYSAIACGLPPPLDCAVLFDAGGALEFLKFDSRALKTDDDGAPVQSSNPLRTLAALKKPHFSWPTPINASNPVLLDYARITHSLSVSGAWTTESQIQEAVAACHASDLLPPPPAGQSSAASVVAEVGTPCSIVVNFSPWSEDHSPFPTSAPPTLEGPLVSHLLIVQANFSAVSIYIFCCFITPMGMTGICLS